MKSSRKLRPRNLQFETLETRQLMAANISAAFSGGVLTVTGSNSDDTVNFLQTKGRISIKDVSGSWAATDVKSIIVSLQAGNDVVSLASIPNGGGEAMSELVTVKSGAGLERVRLHDGRDVYFGGAGNSLEFAANNTAKLNGAAANISANANTALSEK